MRRARGLLFALFLGAFVLLQWSPSVPAFANQISDKAEHAALYYVFALLLWPLLPSTDPLARAGAVVSLGYLVALTMEAGQVHLPHRTPDPSDAVADLAGLLLAAAPLWWSGQHPMTPMVRRPEGPA